MMKINWRRVNFFIAFSFVSSVVYSSFLNFSLGNVFLGAMYTVVGVIFSVEMSMLYSLNPGRVKNNRYYRSLKSSILRVRDTSFALFLAISICFVVSICSSFEYLIFLAGCGIRFSFICFTIFFSVVVTVYLAWNFVVLQDLNYEIEENLRNIKNT